MSADALSCADGPVKTLVGLSLVPEHRSGHGAMYALDCGRLEVGSLRRGLAGLPLPRAVDGRLMPGRRRVAVLDAALLPSAVDLTMLTCTQIRGLVGRLIAAGQRRPGGPDLLIVFDARLRSPANRLAAPGSGYVVEAVMSDGVFVRLRLARR